jgi:hypothetical protein
MCQRQVSNELRFRDAILITRLTYIYIHGYSGTLFGLRNGN